jgi:hypothetical protein
VLPRILIVLLLSLAFAAPGARAQPATLGGITGFS